MEKKTYEELENEVAALKRSCASYKSENTKLRARVADYARQYVELSYQYNLLQSVKDEYCEELAKLQTRSWWERFKALFWVD